MQSFETLVSSGGHRPLSNFAIRFLNNCCRIVRQRVPQCCWLCGAPTRSALCSECEQELPRLPQESCPVCALPLAGEPSWCGACLKRPPRFERVVAPFAYRFPVDALVHAFKYGGRLALARPLGEALAQAVTQEAADAIVPMPLSARRLAERGFNQALELARVVAARTGLPLLREACRKVTDTPPQAALPWKVRAKNVRRAFVCDAELTGLRIAVVDDVLTTGATLEELARVLRRAGAASVAGWVVARTLPR